MPLGNSIKGIIQIPTVYDLTGISGEVNDVCIVGNNCVITTDENGAVIPLDYLEINIVQAAITLLMPEYFKMEISYRKDSQNDLRSRCSIIGTKKHATLAYAYGESTLSACIQCLVNIHDVLKRNGYGIYTV